MTDVTHIVGVSGGKDSTALALLLAEREPRDYTYLITPTGNELPEMEAHWAHLEILLGKPLTRVTNRTLDAWIDEFNALPNHRQRWCTRLLKIEPTIAFVRALARNQLRRAPRGRRGARWDLRRNSQSLSPTRMGL